MDWEPRPGMLVICIDDEWFPPEPSPLVRNRVYTVSTVGYGLGILPDGHIAAGTMVNLIEAKNPHDRECWDLGHEGFYAGRFRPVDPERIEIFRRLVAPVDRVPA